MSLKDMQDNIAHVVHVMFENRGFDTLLGWLYDGGSRPAVNIPALRAGEAPFYGVPRDANGNPTFWLPDDASFYGSGPYKGSKKFIHKGNWNLCYMPPADPGEVWDDVTQQIYGPNRDFSLPDSKLMRGFYLNYAAAGKGVGSNDDILATSTPADLTVINTLARSFAVSDMWFASAPTQTNPNRAFSLAGTSMGRQNNLSFDGVPFKGLRTIFGILNDTGNSWKLYADHTWIHGLYFTQYMFPEGMSGGAFGSLDDFKNDVAKDALPVFSYIEPTFATESVLNPLGNDYHPPGSLFEGEKTLKRVYDALVAKPSVFRKTLLIVTFDEHGGTFDHVPPPTNAVDPDALDPPYLFGRYGVRIPTLLVSPCVPAGAVFRAGYYPGAPGSPHPYDHTSVLATLLNWRGIPYQEPTDKGWLRLRVRSAPTFEDVITAPTNPNTPSVKPFSCHDVVATVGDSNVPVVAVPHTVSRITGVARGTTEHDALVASVLTARTQQEVGEAFQDLRRRYGGLSRDGVRAR